MTEPSRPRRPDRPGPVLSTLGVLAGLASVALGVGLLRRVESLFGLVWATGLVILGAIVLASWVVLRSPPSRPRPTRGTTCDGEPARFYPRPTGLATAYAFTTLLLLGGWFAAIGIVGQIEQNWVWPVLAVVPAAYFLGFVVLGAAGRFRPGGVWVSATRVVNEHYGLRSELALADVSDLSARPERVVITPRDGAVVRRQRLTPRPWRAAQPDERLEIWAADLVGGPVGLVVYLQEQVDHLSRRRSGPTT